MNLSKLLSVEVIIAATTFAIREGKVTKKGFSTNMGKVEHHLSNKPFIPMTFAVAGELRQDRLEARIAEVNQELRKGYDQVLCDALDSYMIVKAIKEA